MSGESGPVYVVPPVQRALKVLRHIADGNTAENVSVTAKALGISRTTLIRLLHTLEAEELIEPSQGGAGYRLGFGLITLGAKALVSRDLLLVARPFIADLANALGLSGHLGVLEGRDVLYLLRHAPDRALVSNIRIGSRLPAHTTAMGRILLAYMPFARVKELFAEADLYPVTAQTATTYGALERLLDADRAHGAAWSDSYYEAGISSCAAPVFDHSGACVAAINVTGPEGWFNDGPDRRPTIERAVRAAAAEISRGLGFMPTGGEQPAG